MPDMKRGDSYTYLVMVFELEMSGWCMIRCGDEVTVYDEMWG